MDRGECEFGKWLSDNFEFILAKITSPVLSSVAGLVAFGKKGSLLGLLAGLWLDSLIQYRSFICTSLYGSQYATRQVNNWLQDRSSIGDFARSWSADIKKSCTEQQTIDDAASNAVTQHGSGECGEEQVSGGQAGDRRRIQLTSNRGTISISYNHYSIPDRLQVIYEGKTVIDTGFVPDTGNPSFELQGQANFAEVIVTGNPQDSSTQWSYTLSCPQQTQQPGQPEPGQDKFFEATLSKSEISLRDSAILTVRYVNPDNNTDRIVVSGNGGIRDVVVNIPPAQRRSGEFRFIVTNRGSSSGDCASNRYAYIHVQLYSQGGLLPTFFSKQLDVYYTGGLGGPTFLCQGTVVPQ